MSVLLQTRKCLFRKSLYNKFCKYVLLRKSSDLPKKFLTFDEVVAQRRHEARRSIVVQVNSESSFNELYGYCSKYATINGIHHYKNSGEEHFMLVEFNSENEVNDVLKSCGSHHKDVDIMAVQSPFLWFRAASIKQQKCPVNNRTLVTKNGIDNINEDALFEDLLNCNTISDQIQMLYERTILNDLGVRLRYMVARQLEIVFKSLYANIKLQPFGSSVNGFGRMGCDLDLVLTNALTEDMTLPNNRLVYHEKKCEGGRTPWQKHMELVGSLLDLRVSGASRVQRILNARVPIVKYTHDLADLDCDLCYNNMSGVYMSELLWGLGELEARARPLAVAVRCWASAASLTNAHPGRWITNFPLTLMVLFFLQTRRILPTVKDLVTRAEKGDIRVTEDNLNCTFLRDLNKLPEDAYGQDDSDLQSLLFQFFEFYSQFDFSDKAISINEGRAIRKPNALPLYIVNPLEQVLNVSRNVSFEECERLKLELRNAAWHLEGCLEDKKSEDWGLLGLIERKSSRGLKKLLRVGNSHRLISVKDLFNDEEEPQPEGLTSKLKKIFKSDKVETVKEAKSDVEKVIKIKEDKLKFKNSQTAKEVYRIRRNKLV